MAETMALLNRFNAISDRFAEPLEDDEMAKLRAEVGSGAPAAELSQGAEPAAPAEEAK